MQSAADILAANGLQVPSFAPGRYYSTCPKCSASRQREHQKFNCVGVTIGENGSVHFGCNHCGWRGPTKANGHGGGGNVVATYDYVDEAGELLFQKVRLPNKNFWQQRPDGHGGWIKDTKGVRKLLYRLPELRAAIANGRTVLCVEDRDRQTARRPPRHRSGNRKGATMGCRQDQNPHQRRQAHRPLHEAGFF